MKAYWRFRAAAVISLALASLPAGAAGAAGVQQIELVRPEGARHYLLQLPQILAAEGRVWPMVILLHGHGGSAAQLMGTERSVAPMSVWRQLAVREGLIIVAPDGLRGSDGLPGWNDCRDDAIGNPDSDDVGFVDASIEREIAQDHADPGRIYAMGMSNGGVFVYRLAAQAKHPLAGFAAVSASMPAASRCAAPTRPTSALVIGGTADPLMPYAGGEIHLFTQTSRGKVIGAEATAAAWRRIDGLLDPPAHSERIEHVDPQDRTQATRTEWGADRAGLQVELLRIEGGGHVEPSRSQRYGRLYLSFVGAQSGDVEVAEEAWAFFKPKHLTREYDDRNINP